MSRWSSPLSLLALAALGSLAGCGDDTAKFPPACPALSLLRDAADLTRYGPTGHDLRDLVLQARITAVPAQCATGTKGTVKATMRVAFDVTRGPAAASRQAGLDYFVAVSEADKVLDEQDYVVAAAFPPNTDHVTVTGDDITLALPVSKTKSAAAYHIYVGFRLTPDDLAANRARAAR